MSRRVAILCEFPTLNGGERSLLAALSTTRAAGWEPVALCPAEGDLADAFRDLKIDVIGFDPRGMTSLGDGLATRRAELTSLLQRWQPELIHANSISMGRLSGPVIAELGVPSVAHLRDIVSLSGAAVADLNRHARLLAVSEATRLFHVAQGADAGRIAVLYNGVETELFQPRKPAGWLHGELGLAADAMLVGCIGQIILRKGQDVLVQAARLLAERQPNLHYVFVGARHSEKPETRQFEADLRAAFQQPSLVGRGHFVGARNDVEKILRELSMLAHPARQEPLGRVLIESAAAGLPIVATLVGGTAEIFPPKRGAALLVPPGDAPALAAAMERLAGDAGLRRELGERARARALEQFDARIAAEGLARHYNEVVSEFRHPS